MGIRTVYAIQCDYCSRKGRATYSNKGVAASAYKNGGWHVSPNGTWKCPQCAREGRKETIQGNHKEKT